MFDRIGDYIITRLLLAGAVIGIGLVGVVFGIIAICRHITIGWNP